MQRYRVHSGIQALMDNKKYSDLTLKCGDREFNVHRAIICPQSDFFAKICELPFKEAQNNIVELNDDDPDDIARMINYFYKSDYDDDSSDGYSTDKSDNLVSGGASPRSARDDRYRKLVLHSEAPSSPTDFDFSYPAAVQAQLNNVAVYGLAEKYIIPELKELAVSKFEGRPWETWMHGCGEVLRAVYTTTPDSDRGLRAPLIALCIQSRSDLHNKDCQQALKEFPSAEVDILREILSVKESTIVDLRISLKSAVEKSEFLVDENNDLKYKADEMKNELEFERKAFADYWAMFMRAFEVDKCSHCNTEFHAKADKGENHYYRDSDRISLRCAKCSLRQTVE